MNFQELWQISTQKVYIEVGIKNKSTKPW